MAEQATAEIRAAGAVVWRQSAGGAEVALVHRPKYNDWSFAKGKLLPGEHVLLAAVREVAEETGLQVALGRRLPTVRYRTEDARKRVDYWVAPAGSQQPLFAPNSEVDEIEWLTVSAAAGRLQYAHDARTLADFEAGPRTTAPLILVRHASAGTKANWSKPDETRPLDRRGKKQAKLLASLLSCFGAGQVVSSPTERCAATVRPYAKAAGLDLETDPVLLPDATGQEGSAAAALMARLAVADRPVVVCAHRENLPALLAAACGVLGTCAPETRPLRKGEFLVLHRDGARLAGLERYNPSGRG